MLSKRPASVTSADIDADMDVIAQAVQLADAKPPREPDDPKRFREALEELRLHLLDAAQAAAELGVDTSPIDIFLHAWHSVWKDDATFAQAAKRIPLLLTDDVMTAFGCCMRRVQRMLRADGEEAKDVAAKAAVTEGKRRKRRVTGPRTFSAALTPQEKKAAELKAKGFSNKEIGREMRITPQRAGQLLKGVFTKISRLTGASRQSVQSCLLPTDMRGQVTAAADEVADESGD